MRRAHILNRLSGMTIALALLFLWTPSPSRAQVALTTQTQESIDVVLGSIFEVLAVEPQTGSTVSWVLNKSDGTFIQADRGHVFRERFSEQGMFTLRAEMTLPDQQTNLLHTFQIRIIPSDQSAQVPNPPGAMVRTEPSTADGRTVVLGTERHSVRLTPLLSDGESLSLDVDAGTDSNGDGNPTNDPDSAGTFFQSNGTSLILWFPVTPVQRTLTFTGTTAQGPVPQTTVVSTSPVSPSVSSSSSTPDTAGSTLIGVENRGNGAFAFRLKEETLSSSGRALLFLWDFGDSRQSMLDRPVHTYAANGSYTVLLKVRDLKTTQQVLQTSGALQVTSVPVPGAGSTSSEQANSSAASEEASSSASADSSVSSEPSEGGGSAIGLILTIVGVVLGSLVIGILLMLVLSRVVKKKLDETEGPQPKKGKKPSGEKTKPESLDQQPPPMSVIDIESSHAPVPERMEKTVAPPPLEIQEEQAPAWLRQGVEKAKTVGQTLFTPPPPALQEQPPVAPPPSPPESIPEPPQQDTATEPVEEKTSIPPWLKESPKAPAALAPEPQEEAPTVPREPAPVQDTREAPSSEPVPAPVAEPIETADTVPAADEEAATEDTASEKELSPEEKERRRKKRQRYRANKRKRELETKAQEAAPTAGDVMPPPAEEEEEPDESENAQSDVVPETPAQNSAAANHQKQEEPDETIAIIRADNIPKEDTSKKK